MSPTLKDAEQNTRQVRAKSAKPSQTPNRPASGLEIRRARPHYFSISTAGSPEARAMSAVTSTPMSPTAVSKIPKAPPTPLNALVPKHLHSKPVAVYRSSLPVPRREYDMLIPHSPPALERKGFERMASFDKPLPSPPIARFVDPNSPTKAQRTLVDAEAGIPSVAAWPVLRPESTFTPEAELTTDDTGLQQRQQQPRQSQHDVMSNASNSEQTANTLVKNRKTSSGTASTSRTNLAVSQSEQHVQPIERRSFSSNNPYAKIVDTVSSGADASSRRPRSHNASTPLPPPIPLRRSSKRKSLPLSRRDWSKVPHLPTVTPGNDIELSTATRPLSALQPEQPLITDSAVFSSEQPLVTATRPLSALQPEQPLITDSAVFSSEQPLVTAVSENSHGDSLDTSEREEVSNTSIAKDAARDGMSLIKYEPADTWLAASLVHQAWVQDPATGWWSRTLAWRADEPHHGPVLRIHKDIEAILFGDEKNFPADSIVPDLPTSSSLSRTLHSIAKRASWQSSHKAPSSSRSPTQASLPIRPAVKEGAPVVISPIRSMRPARQPSAPVSPKSLSLPEQSSPREVMAAVTMVNQANSGTSATKSSSIEVLPAQLASLNQADDIVQDVPPEQAKKKPGCSHAATSAPAKGNAAPSWMSPTISSLMARNGGRKASQAKTSVLSASGASRPATSSASATSRGPSRLRASGTPASAADTLTVSRSTQTESGKSSRGEAKSKVLLKAKKSLRNLFAKSSSKVKPEEAKPEVPSPPLPESPTTKVFHHLVEIVMSLPPKSAEQMRGLEATEALLYVVTMYKKQCTQARDAELAAASSRQTVVHMLKVCGGLFGGEAGEVLGELAESLGLKE